MYIKTRALYSDSYTDKQESNLKIFDKVYPDNPFLVLKGNINAGRRY